MEFQVEDKVMLKVSPWKEVVRFGKRGKLNPMYVGPFKVLEKVGEFQKLISLLEVHGAAVSNEDANQKFLRALPSSWNNVALIMRNKIGIDDLDIDDLYNNLKGMLEQQEIKGNKMEIAGGYEEPGQPPEDSHRLNPNDFGLLWPTLQDLPEGTKRSYCIHDIDGGFVAFGGSTKGGKITGIDKIRTNKIDFEDVFFEKELKFKLSSVSQMCDKKNNVLFTETECLKKNVDAGHTEEENVSTQQYIVFLLWSSISSSYKCSDDKTEILKHLKNVLDKTMDQEKDAKSNQMLLEKSLKLSVIASFFRRRLLELAVLTVLILLAHQLITVSALQGFFVLLDNQTGGPSFVPFGVSFLFIGSKVSSTNKGMTKKNSGELAMISYIQKQRRNKSHRFQERTYYLLCFLSQLEPTKISQALMIESWVEAMQEELAQFRFQKVLDTSWTYLSGKKAYWYKVGSKALIMPEVFAPGARLKQFSIRTASNPMDTNKALTKDEDGDDVDVHLYSVNDWSLMYLTSSRPNRFLVCAGSRFQVQPNVTTLECSKKNLRYIKGQPNWDFWDPKDSSLTLEASYRTVDYAGASLDRKSTTGGLGGPPIKVGNEAVHKELGDIMEKAATTASSFEAEQDSESGKPTQVFDVPKIYPNLFKQAKAMAEQEQERINFEAALELQK
ncbi:hypothetical protein Tco_0918945 [Tanacetum coccineum]